MQLRLVMHSTVRLHKRLSPARMRLSLIAWMLEARAIMQQVIVSTVKRGKTGQLSTNVGYELIRSARAFGVRITPRAPYALAVERGAAPHFMAPRNASVMAWNVATEQVASFNQETSSVRYSRGHVHPGFGAKLYFRKALQTARPILRVALRKALRTFTRRSSG